MRIIVCLHPCGTSGSSTSAAGASLNHDSALSSIYATAADSTAATAVMSLSLPAFYVAAATTGATSTTAVAVSAASATSPTDQL